MYTHMSTRRNGFVRVLACAFAISLFAAAAEGRASGIDVAAADAPRVASFVATSRTVYAAPGTDERRVSRVSVASEIDWGRLSLAILGLAGMRLWCGTRKTLLAVE